MARLLFLLGICCSTSLARPGIDISNADFDQAISNSPTEYEKKELAHLKDMSTRNRQRAIPDENGDMPLRNMLETQVSRIHDMPDKLRDMAKDWVDRRVKATKRYKQARIVADKIGDGITQIKDTVNEAKFNKFLARRKLDESSSIEDLTHSIREKPLTTEQDGGMKHVQRVGRRVVSSVVGESREMLKDWDKYLEKQTPILKRRLLKQDKHAFEWWQKKNRQLHTETMDPENLPHRLHELDKQRLKLWHATRDDRKYIAKTADSLGDAGAAAQKWVAHKVVQTGRAAIHGANLLRRASRAEATDVGHELGRRVSTNAVNVGNWLQDHKPARNLAHKVANNLMYKQAAAQEKVRELSGKTQVALERFTGKKNPEFPVAAVAGAAMKKATRPAVAVIKGVASARRLAAGAVHSVASNKEEWPILSDIAGKMEGARYPIAAAAGEALKKAVVESPLVRVAKAVGQATQ